MIVRIEGETVVCSQLEKQAASRHEVVPTLDTVEFDAHLNRVPVHVEARLTAAEIDELESFLSDKQRIEEKSEQRVILEALPGLIDKGVAVLTTTTEVDSVLHQALVDATERMRNALAREPEVSEQSERSEVGASEEIMQADEVQKMRLNVLRRTM